MAIYEELTVGKLIVGKATGQGLVDTDGATLSSTNTLENGHLYIGNSGGYASVIAANVGEFMNRVNATANGGRGFNITHAGVSGSDDAATYFTSNTHHVHITVASNTYAVGTDCYAIANIVTLGSESAAESTSVGVVTCSANTITVGLTHNCGPAVRIAYTVIKPTT